MRVGLRALLCAGGEPPNMGNFDASVLMPAVPTSLMGFLKEPAARKYLQEFVTERGHLLTLQVSE